MQFVSIFGENVSTKNLHYVIMLRFCKKKNAILISIAKKNAILIASPGA